MPLSGRLVVVEGRDVVDAGRSELVDDGRCDEATGRFAVVGRLVVVVVGRLVVVVVGRTLLPLLGLTLLLGLALLPAVLALLGVLTLGVRELIDPAVLLRRTLAT